MLAAKSKTLTMTLYNLVPGDFSNLTAFPFPSSLTLFSTLAFLLVSGILKGFLPQGCHSPFSWVFPHGSLLKFIHVVVSVSHPQMVLPGSHIYNKSPTLPWAALFFISALFTTCNYTLLGFIYLLVDASTIIIQTLWGQVLYLVYSYIPNGIVPGDATYWLTE